MLESDRWDLAILSTLVLANTSTRTAAAAFELPYTFPTIQTAIDLQETPIGRAGLSSFSERGMTGLVYLNAGVALLAGRGDVGSPEALRGKKIAVSSTAQVQSVEKLGSSPVQFDNVRAALQRGAVDSVLIQPSNRTTWNLVDRGFLLTNSVKAEVAVVVTRDASWSRMPFVYRAMIGDAAVAASRRFDRASSEAEREFAIRAKSQGLSLVTFQSEDATRATRQWISGQPEAMRGIYTNVYDKIKEGDQQTNRPLTPGRGGQTGRVYFATTRDDTGHGTFSYRFGDARTDVVKCGQIQYSLTNPGQSAASFVGKVTADNTACGTYLGGVLQSNKRVLIFVHGFSNRFSEAAERAIALKNAIGNEIEVVLWSWPSKRDGLVGSYPYDKESVGGVARHRFDHLLKALKAHSERTPLSILAHSMGGWHTIGVLQGLSDHPDRPNIQNVVFAAPDVPTDEFNFALKDLDPTARRITLYACRWDVALILSKEINEYPRAGYGGERDIVVANKLESIDVDSKWFSINHSYVFETGKVLDDLTALVLSDSGASNRGLLQKPKAGWHYWSFPE
jgi:esterase/lipase superfamily enzyme/TRAP-type C4-dicarboxylate transport system substrate-binding protein